MSEYNFHEIETKWQTFWEKNQSFKAELDKSKPKFYILDMFPYPSGAGLHVGHPLGYIASDIIARYKKNKGFNVLHPMGFDAFGLPAEQYAIQTGQHPAIITEKNIQRYKEQLKKIGLSFDWDKEVKTCDPQYYRWTQWIFIQLFYSWYDQKESKAKPINTLIETLEREGNINIKAACDDNTPKITPSDWQTMSETQKSQFLLKYRLAYLAETTVNWCPELGTVLANEEVKDGLSERGGYPVIRKKMQQWSLRITAYAEQLLNDLDKIDWPEPIKEMQRHWIGQSIGAEFCFDVENSSTKIDVFTTRIDTVFGVTFLALAPESEYVNQITTAERKKEVENYVNTAKNRSERDRMSDVKTITGIFTGAYAIHPFTSEKIPVWVADYVLGGYGTGAVMAVPAHDSRDYAFAKHFNIPIRQVVEGGDVSKEAYEAKTGKLMQSDFMNGLDVKQAMNAGIAKLEEKGIGKAKTNYKLRDAIFSRQRYWGEPFPVYYQNELPHMLSEEQLPLTLPDIDIYLPTESGEPPLGRVKDWTTKDGLPLELSTMPGWAGSSWYFFRYMDSHNTAAFVGKENQTYWENVDIYIGGSEHATGHLLYARFWTKFLFDLGYVNVNEPFKKLINQGMIQGRSNFVYRVKDSNTFVSLNLKNNYDTTPIHVDVNLVKNDILDITSFKKWRKDFADAEFVLEDGQYICGSEIEKMSKRWHNVVNPDDIIAQYGADTLRLYEMFLGPIEQSKPWNTNGIDGVSKFLKKLWRLFYDQSDTYLVADEPASKDALKILHKTIKKVEEDINTFSFNTSVSAFMVCVNELHSLKCHNKEVLSKLLIILSPFAPHITEELWSKLGYKESILEVDFPAFNPEYLVEDSVEYPVSVNGKLRAKMTFPANFAKEEIEKGVLQSDTIKKWLEGRHPKKIIVVPKRIVNIVV